MNNKQLRNTLILVFLLFANLINGQTNLVQDSLLKIIPTLKDSLKLIALEHLVTITPQDELRRIYLRAYIEEATKRKKPLDIAWGKIHLIHAYYSQFETDSIFIVAKEAETYFIEHKFYDWYFNGKQITTQRYIDQGRYSIGLKEALDTYAKAKELDQPPSVIAKSLSTLANSYINLGESDLGINYYKESNILVKGDTLSGLGAENYMNLTTAYINKKDYPNALLYTDSLQLYLDNEKPSTSYRNNSMYYYFCEIYRTKIFALMGNSKQSAKHLEAAKKMLDPDWGAVPVILLDNASIDYYNSVSNYKKALEHVDTLLAFATQNNLPLVGGILPQTLEKAGILSEMGKHKEACEYYENYITISDSLSVDRLGKQVNEMRTIYELDKAEMQVEQQKLSILAQRNMIAGLIAGCVLLFAIGILIYMYSRKLRAKNRILYKQIQEQDKLEEEIEDKNTYIYQHSTDSELIRNGKLFAALKELMKDESIYTQTDIDRKAIADMLGTNEKYLFDSIKENAGLSFSEYINGLRLNLAKKLLSADNNFTIEDIAMQSGFGSRTTFHRQFREKHQLSPSEFRKAALEEGQK